MRIKLGEKQRNVNQNQSIQAHSNHRTHLNLSQYVWSTNNPHNPGNLPNPRQITPSLPTCSDIYSNPSWPISTQSNLRWSTQSETLLQILPACLLFQLTPPIATWPTQVYMIMMEMMQMMILMPMLMIMIMLMTMLMIPIMMLMMIYRPLSHRRAPSVWLHQSGQQGGTYFYHFSSSSSPFFLFLFSSTHHNLKIWPGQAIWVFFFGCVGSSSISIFWVISFGQGGFKILCNLPAFPVFSFSQRVNSLSHES